MMQMNSEILNTSRVELTISHQKKLTTYNNYSLPLCSLLWNTNYEPWLYEHFTQLYASKDNKSLWVDYLEPLYYPNDICEYFFIRANELIEIEVINELKRFIKEGYYILIVVDRRQIPSLKLDMDKYILKKVIPTQVLLYGFDESNETFLGYGLKNDSSWGEHIYSYKLIEKSHSSCLTYMKKLPIWVNWYNIVVMRPKQLNTAYVANKQKIIKDVNDYLHSTPNIYKLRPEILLERNNNISYGWDIQKRIIYHMKKKTEL